MGGGGGGGRVGAQMKEEAPTGSRSSFLPLAWAYRMALGKSLSSQEGSSHLPFPETPMKTTLPQRCQRLPCPARHSLQAWLWQYTEGTHRLEEPVSKRTRKFCGGVPMLISPK